MILKNRLFARKEANRDAKSVFIFCEGKKREFQYFQYFKEIDSRINIEVYPLKSTDNNSPTGLYKMAVENLIVSEENPNPKYEMISGDEVWFVIDTDDWGPKISELREACLDHVDWDVTQSNPCFEVWLAFHFEKNLPDFKGSNVSKQWKQYVAKIVQGGFNSNKHPIYLETAISYSKHRYAEGDHGPLEGSTEVYRLGSSINELIRDKLKVGLAQIIEEMKKN